MLDVSIFARQTDRDLARRGNVKRARTHHSGATSRSGTSSWAAGAGNLAGTSTSRGGTRLRTANREVCSKRRGRNPNQPLDMRCLPRRGSPRVERFTHPKMVISHSKMLSSSTKPAENPSTGFLRRAGRQGKIAPGQFLSSSTHRGSSSARVIAACPALQTVGASGLTLQLPRQDDGRS